MKQTLRGNIALVGFMGVGKTTLLETALRKGLPGVDTDELIQNKAGIPVSEIFAQYGEPYFRDLEAQAVRQAAALTGTVISCGGGAVLRPENVRALQETGTVVLLTATPETVLERLADDDTRPKLRGRKTVAGVAELMAERAAAYAAAAQVTIVTDGKTPDAIWEEILAAVQPSAKERA